jgi:preprotein translocase subunit SecG
LTTVLLLVHLFVTLALIGVVLIQRSEGGGLGIGTSQGMGSFMSGRGTANLLTRVTAVLATIFMLLSLALGLLNRGTTGVSRSILDLPPASAPAAPGGTGSGNSGGTNPGGASGGGPQTAPAGAAPSGAGPSGAAPAAPGATSPAPASGAGSSPSVPTN